MTRPNPALRFIRHGECWETERGYAERIQRRDNRITLVVLVVFVALAVLIAVFGGDAKASSTYGWTSPIAPPWFESVGGGSCPRAVGWACQPWGSIYHEAARGLLR